MSQHHDWVAIGTYLSAGVALVSLQQAAFVLTIISTLIAIVLGAIKLHDRLRYGPSK
jgi:hypothetical protein